MGLYHYKVKKTLNKNSKGKREKMNLKLARKDHSFRPNPKVYHKPLTFFPLSQSTEDLCQNINKNLFQLEKNLAYFHFAIQEIKDIT